MLGVKLLAHGSDAAAGNGFLTAGAEGAAALVVMSLTVGLPFMLEETAIHKWSETLLWRRERKQKSVSYIQMIQIMLQIKQHRQYMQQYRHLISK